MLSRTGVWPWKSSSADSFEQLYRSVGNRHRDSLIVGKIEISWEYLQTRMVLFQRAAEKSSRLGRVSSSPLFARFFIIDCGCVSLARAIFTPSLVTIVAAAEEEEKASNHELTEYRLMLNRAIGSSLQPRGPKWTLDILYQGYGGRVQAYGSNQTLIYGDGFCEAGCEENSNSKSDSINKTV